MFYPKWQGGHGMIIPSKENRRRHERIKKELRIRWGDQEVGFHGVTLDICPGGIFIITERVLPINSSLQVEVLLDDGSTMMCLGKVAWVNRGQLDHYPPGFGVEFLNLPVEVRLVLFHSLTGQEGFEGRL